MAMKVHTEEIAAGCVCVPHGLILLLVEFFFFRFSLHSFRRPTSAEGSSGKTHFFV